MKRIKFASKTWLACSAGIALMLTAGNVSAVVTNTWANTATSFTDGTSWVGGVAPGAADVARFIGTPTNHPVLNTDAAVGGLLFESANWQLNGSGRLTNDVLGVTVLTGTITLNAPLYLAANQSWWIADGRTLIVNGSLSGTGNIVKPKTSEWGSPSPIRLMADNSAYGGQITVNNGVVEIGHNNALGTNAIVSASVYGAQSPTLVSYGGNRSISTLWMNGFKVNSAYDLTVGDTSAAQDGSKSLSWDNTGTGKLIISGIMRISVKESTFSGTGPIQIAGSASNTGMNQNENDGMKIAATLVELNKTSGKDVCGGHFTLLAGGTARWLADDQLNNSKRLNMRGGTVDLNNHSETTGALYLSASSVVSMGTGASSLSLADSSVVSWTPATILTVKAFTEGVDALRVGTSASGLTLAQLDQIRFEGYRNASARMDTQGYVYPPKPLGTTVVIR